MFYSFGYIVLLPALLMFFFSPFMYSTYIRSRRKGHSPPVTALVLAAACGLGIAVAAYVIPRDLPRDNVHLFFLYYFLSPLLLSIAFSAVAVVLLPTRNARVFGARKPAFPFVRVGQAIVGLASLLIVATIFAAFRYNWEAAQISNALTLALGFLLPIGLYFFYLERRLKAPPLTDLLQADSRAPVLYLRAFTQESQFFVIGPKYKYGAYASGLSARLAKDGQNVGVAFEEYFAGDLNRSIGPFVALGSPEDYIPPEGAARTYATDTDWMERVRDLATKAACILVEVGKSANLRLEFEYLRRKGLQQRLFVITHPRRPAQTKLAYAYYSLIWRLKEIRSISWNEFVDDLGKMGYQLSCDDPGPGAVVSFDQDGKGILLTTEADLPSDYIGPISAWIGKKEKIGNCVQTKCASCGRSFYVSPLQVNEASRRDCPDCELAAQSTSKRWFENLGAWYGLWLTAATLFVTIGSAIWLPDTPWFNEWVGWLDTGAIVALALLPFGVRLLLRGRGKRHS